MLKRIKDPDPRNLFFAALLLFSLALHVLILSQLQWQIRLPDKTETVFEVELLKPEKKIIPKPKPKPKPAVIKLKPAKVETDQPKLVEQKKAPKPAAAKPEAAPDPKPAPAKKPKPKPKPKPLPKPKLSIESDLGRSVDLEQSDVPVGELTPQTPLATPMVSQVNTPESLADDHQVLPENPKPAPKLSFDPEDLKRVPRKDTPDTGQIAQSESDADIKTEITSKKDTVRYRVVEQGGDGTAQVRGTADNGENMIEGELRQRKVIYKPDPPVLNLEKDVTITLKFTVLATGEVDRIYPYRKGERELEQLAMRLLRQYRFEPLFENDKTQEGIIHFTIFRNR